MKLVLGLALGVTFTSAHICSTDADCTDVVDDTCVVAQTTPSSSVSECISCDPDQFQLECPHWSNRYLFNASEVKCGLTCEHEFVGCSSDSDCTDAIDDTCVNGFYWGYSQCISCDPVQFQYDCPSFSNQSGFDVLAAAESTCGMNCTDWRPAGTR